MQISLKRAGILLVCAFLPLGGCVEQLGDIRGSFASGPSPTKVAVGSLRGAIVALASVDAPPEIAARFSSLFSEAATSQEIALTDIAKANYLVRGYLSAYPVEGGTAVGYVWDVFDKAKHRTQRVSDAIVLKSSPADAWSVASEAVLSSLADKSVGDLAVFLAQTPEVIAAAETAVPLPVRRPAGPLAYAPVE